MPTLPLKLVIPVFVNIFALSKYTKFVSSDKSTLDLTGVSHVYTPDVLLAVNTLLVFIVPFAGTCKYPSVFKWFIVTMPPAL